MSEEWANNPINPQKPAEAEGVQPPHPEEPAEGSVEDVEAPGVERSEDVEEANQKVPEGGVQPPHPEEPAEGSAEDVEASAAERTKGGPSSSA